MKSSSYRVAKRCDAVLQGAALVSGFAFTMDDVPGANYYFVGRAHLLSRMIRMIITPAATAKGGRGRYTASPHMHVCITCGNVCISVLWGTV